jgi:predicted metal-binding protein
MEAHKHFALEKKNLPTMQSEGTVRELEMMRRLAMLFCHLCGEVEEDTSKKKTPSQQMITKINNNAAPRALKKELKFIILSRTEFYVEKCY